MNSKTLSFIIIALMILATGCSNDDDDSSNGNGTPSLGFEVTIYDADKACNGTTFFVYKYVDPDILYEVDMNGEPVWEYELPEEMGSNQTEAELISNDSILIVNQSIGLAIINRNGDILWEYDDPKVSHDADLLDNGNILYIFGMGDAKIDTIVKEITPDGDLVWWWRAFEYFNYPPYSEINPGTEDGWTHINTVSRLDNGNTLVSLRNFDMIVEINPDGTPVDTIIDVIDSPHDPQLIDDEHILVAHQTPIVHSAINYNKATDVIEWRFDDSTQCDMPMRDVNLLPNGNILITCASRLIEVIPSTNEIVWQLELTDSLFPGEGAGKGFYKAERITE